MIKKIFLAGIIQGSHKDKTIHAQDYRRRLKSIVNEYYPQASIYDPFDGHSNSVEYDDRKGRATFDGSLERIGECDLVIAYLPVASLGTAIEIWESHKRGIPVWTISGMKDNWVVRFCSERVFDDIEAFEKYLEYSSPLSLKEE